MVDRSYEYASAALKIAAALANIAIEAKRHNDLQQKRYDDEQSAAEARYKFGPY